MNDNILLNNILSNIKLSIFWKDINRRFIGANKCFLDYYDFKLEDIVGKTDEDMNWHIDPEPFKLEEEKVINNGEEVIELQGTCIIRGQMRYIVASKYPLYDNDNNIIGLWGYFRDNTDEVLSSQNKSNTDSTTDSLTGLLNRQALEDQLIEYEKSYYVNNKDFVLYLLNIEHFKMYNDVYGLDAGDNLLKNLSYLLLKLFNNTAIIIRHSGNEFIIVKQFKDNNEIYECEKSIHNIFSELNIECSIGHAVYSEILSTENLTKLAEYRMNETKSEKKNKWSRG